jgi:hypothetical protein
VGSGEVQFRRPWGGAGGLVRMKVDIDGTASLTLIVRVEMGEAPLVVEVAPPGPWENLRPGSYKRRKEILTCRVVAPG